MENLEGKTNNEIVIELKQMELDHETLKVKMLKDYDMLMKIEKMYSSANKIINDRLKGVK